MAGRGFAQRAGWRSAAPRLAACVVLIIGIAIVPAAPAPAAAAGPTAPTLSMVFAGPADWSMYLRWSAPHLSGSAAITGYEYRVQIDTGPYSLPAPLAAASARQGPAPCTAPAAAGHGCTYEVRATNGTPGAWSTAVGLNWQLPSVPTLGRAVAGPPAGVATLSWRHPKTNGGLPLEYRYQVNGGTGWSAPFTIDPTSIVAVPGVLHILSAPVPCTITGPVTGCSYMVEAVNGVGPSGFSRTKSAPLSKPGPPTGLSVVTDSVALGTGAATESLSWVAPVNVGGQVLTDYLVSTCATTSGSACFNTSPGWGPPADIPGNPPATNAVRTCPEAARCAHEVWSKNPSGKGWVWTFASPTPPTALAATASTTTSGQIDLQWLNTFDPGTAFGHYVLFECDSSQACMNGDWTNDPTDAAPWTHVDLSGTATTASYPCGTVTACLFRVGYVDAAGNIGGVTNEVALVGV